MTTLESLATSAAIAGIAGGVFLSLLVLYYHVSSFLSRVTWEDHAGLWGKATTTAGWVRRNTDLVGLVWTFMTGAAIGAGASLLLELLYAGIRATFLG